MTKAEQIARNLANKNYVVARAQLNSIQATAKKDVARLKQQASQKGLSKYERFTLNQRLETAQANLDRVTHSVDVVRKAMKDPQHIRTNSAIENLKAFELHKEARKIEYRHFQSKAMKETIKTGSRESTSFVKYATSNKEEILITNLLLENPNMYKKFTKARYDYYVVEFNKYGINFDSDVHKIFQEDKHFNSGDEYQGIQEMISRYSQSEMNRFESEETRQSLQSLINELKQDLEEF